jgi:hypothetical protein
MPDNRPANPAAPGLSRRPVIPGRREGEAWPPRPAVDLSAVWPKILEDEASAHADEARRRAEATDRVVRQAVEVASGYVAEILDVDIADDGWSTLHAHPGGATVFVELEPVADWPDLPAHPDPDATFRWALAFFYPESRAASSPAVDVIALDVKPDRMLVAAGAPISSAAELPEALLTVAADAVPFLSVETQLAEQEAPDLEQDVADWTAEVEFAGALVEFLLRAGFVRDLPTG